MYIQNQELQKEREECERMRRRVHHLTAALVQIGLWNQEAEDPVDLQETTCEFISKVLNEKME